MFGAMPFDFMLLEVGEEMPLEEDDSEPTSAPDIDITWDINQRCVLVECDGGRRLRGVALGAMEDARRIWSRRSLEPTRR